MRIWSALILFFSLSICYSQKKPTSQEKIQKIDAYLSNAVEIGFTGGLLVVEAGATLINKGYGFANKEKQVLNDPEIVFDVGSVTKQFTAVAILKLIELGKLSLTDSLSQFFDNLPRSKERITIHQLLTHTSGLIDGIGRDFDHIDTKSYFKKLFNKRLINVPGSKYNYSNAGYSVLARIIEIVSDQDYEKFLNDNLFKPASMCSTGYLLPIWNEDQFAIGYAHRIYITGSSVNRYLSDGKVSWNLKGNGGINSTQADLLKWYKALRNRVVLNNESFELMTDSYIKRYGGASSYGYGWGVNTTSDGNKKISHNGANGSFYHTLIWRLNDDIFISYWSNSSYPQIESLANEVEKLLIRDSYSPKPIQKGIYSYIVDFAISNHIKNSDELLLNLLDEYQLDYQSPAILNRIGYYLIEQEFVCWAVKLFELNTIVFPYDGNSWDSLGEGFSMINRNRDAVECFEKALQLGTEYDCAWCDNSREKLRSLVNASFTELEDAEDLKN